MATFQPGGYGQEAFGDPFGAGGPLHVVRARAVAGQVVRVTFNEEPVAISPAGLFDAFNPTNYQFSIVSGQATAPQSVGVDEALIRGPVAGIQLGPTLAVTDASNTSPIVITTSAAHGFLTGDKVFIQGVLGNAAANGEFSVVVLSATTFSLVNSVGSGAYLSGGTAQQSSERGVDVHTDRQLVVGITYKVTVVNVQSSFGGSLGAPFAADFVGIVSVQKAPLPRRPQDQALIDIANSIELGAWVVDNSGDLAPQDAMAGLRKRIIRRITTPFGAFSHLPQYGVGVSHKETASTAQIQTLRDNILQQVLQEPEVQSVEVTAQFSASPDGLLIINVHARTAAGALGLQVQRSSQGFVVL